MQRLSLGQTGGRPRAASRPGDPGEQRTAAQYGLLFDEQGRPTSRWEELARGIADCLTFTYPPESSLLTPSKLNLFYSRHRGAADNAFGWPGKTVPSDGTR
ncbi:hypothetical protein KEM52_003537 [Ascosphaera acerosa]|nr:hypothetical protein KEM52_003537 [Ascosphaera acerosa]